MLSHLKSISLYLTWPVVLYTGFSAGSYLIWFNILNATASLVLSDTPYFWGAEAEFRLWPLAICMVMVPAAAVLLWGGVQRSGLTGLAFLRLWAAWRSRLAWGLR
ncbi:transmembrane transport [Ascochyta rabiei]|uniref:Transmembrane transport n=1 Tax=Didymella rabiei TaxID=5454 RepID=A0A162YC98_DIDRA|nr:transmembrane transport [Ascochyta rabiei]